MDHLDRLYHRLVQALAEEGDGGAARPVAIAEIYQRLVPYRAVRDELGFGELAQYEHTLLRLLAGEREYLVVDVAQAQDDFRSELRSNNPIVGIYRDYAAVNVRLNSRAPLAVPTALGAPARREAPAAPDAPAPPRPAPPPPEPELPLSPVPAPPPENPRPAQPADCWSCHSSLPARAELKFCPLCGQSQVAIPCDDCAAPVEPEWSFCIRCGSARPQARGVPSGPAGTPRAENSRSSDTSVPD